MIKISKLNSLLALSIVPAFCTSAINATNKADNSKQKKKNVVLILLDDMRLDMAGFAGRIAKTPNLDALCDESVEFASACTCNGLSSPSRAALFTGRYGHRTGLDDNLDLWHSRLMTLAKEHTTIYEWAHQKGYNIGYFGKWHVGFITPAMRGADEYVGKLGEQVQNKPERPNFKGLDRYYDKTKTFDEKPEYYSTLNISYDKTEAKKQVDLGIKFLEKAEKDKRPVFLTVSFHTPHPPYDVPAPWNKMYDYTKIQLPESYGENKQGLEFQHDIMWPWMNVGHMSQDDWRKTISYAMGTMTMLDQAIGELITELKKQGLWDNSMIVFTSDQGSMLAEHGLYDKGPYAYEGLMRIPMLVKVPGVPHKKIKHQVSLIDLNATMVDFMGLKPFEKNLDSRSLLPLIYKGDDAWKDVPDEAYFMYEWYNGRWFGLRAIRTPEYKYCFNPAGVDELYDLKNDPHEMINRINDVEYKAILSDLRTRLLSHLKQTDDKQAFDLMTWYTNPVKPQTINAD
ncbi:MAG: sulfatase-like hydrolase/transferase [Bacteroidales bacterium]